GGTVLTLDRQIGDFENADVLIEGSKIAAVRPGISAPNAEVISATRAIVMPGFVDTHRHMWEGILRNILPDGSLGDYLRAITGALVPAYQPQDVYAGNLVSALGAIDVGVTTVLRLVAHPQLPRAHGCRRPGSARFRRASRVRLRLAAARAAEQMVGGHAS